MCVVLAVDGVGSGNDRTSCVEGGVDSGFGNGDGLLFHDFVDGDAVDVRHFVEFVNADDAAVGEDHCSGFEAAFAGFFVGSHCGGKTYS